jgi:hypothetical protein
LRAGLPGSDYPRARGARQKAGQPNAIGPARRFLPGAAQLDEAWFFIEKSGIDLDAFRALIQGLKGDKGAALNLARSRVSADAPPLLTARLFAAGGDAAAATHWLETADRRHDFYVRIAARYCPEFDPLRSSAAFTALLEAMTKPRQP